MQASNTKITLPARPKRQRRKSVVAQPADEETFSTLLGPPPQLTREITMAAEDLRAPTPMRALSEVPSPLGHQPLQCNLKPDPPEGFPGLAKWKEVKWQDLTSQPHGTWISYTRHSGYIPHADFAELKTEAKEQGVKLEALVEKYHVDNPPKRKKTVCKLIGYDPLAKSLRVESLPLSGQRASTSFPNQQHSWEIPELWTGDPKYYLVDPEKKRKRARRVSVSVPEVSQEQVMEE